MSNIEKILQDLDQRHAQIRAQITNPTYEQNLLKQLGFDISEFEQPKFDPIPQSSINPSPVTATTSNGNGVLPQSQFPNFPLTDQNNVPPLAINPYQGIPASIPQMKSILPQPEPVNSMSNTGTSFPTGTPPLPLKRNNTQHASNTPSTDPTNVSRSKSMSGNAYQPGQFTTSVVPTAMSEKAQSKLPIDYNTVQPSLPQPFPIQPSVSSNLPITYTSPLAAYMDKLKISENNSSNAYNFSDSSSSYSYSGSSDQPQQTNQASDTAYPGPIPYPGSVVYPGPVPFPDPISPNSVQKQQPSTPTTNLPPNLPPNNLKFPLPFPNGSINNNSYISNSVTPSLPPYSTAQGVTLFNQGSSSVNPETTKTRNMVYMGGDAGVMGSARSTTAIDLCFLVDCTASMEALIDTVRFELYNIIHALSSELQFETANVAFVGYRDFYNKHDQFVIRDFTSDLNEMRNFIANVKTYGNFDNAEDVIGGYDMAVNRIRWTQRNHKLIVHFADYGGHSTGWNSGASDNYSDPNLIQNPRCRPEKMDTYVKDMIENGIYVIFVQLGQPRNTQETVAQIKALFKSYGGTHRFSTQSIGTDYTLIMRDVLNTMKTSLRSSGVKSRNARKYQ